MKLISSTQLRKAESYIGTNKLKAIYKQRVKAKGGKSRGKVHGVPKTDVDGKLSSSTHICDEEDQSVSQFLSIWEEELIA